MATTDFVQAQRPAAQKPANPDGVIAGTAADDTIPGTDGKDVIAAGAGNDVIAGGRGNDAIDGGAGTDTAVYSGNYASYKVSADKAGAWTVLDQHSGSQDGRDDLTGVERLRFADEVALLAANQSPMAAADAATGHEDQPGGIQIAAATLLANDRDPDGDRLIVSAVGDATHGTLSLSADRGTITFTPDKDYSGPASFSYTVSDVLPAGVISANPALAAADIATKTATGTVSLTIGPVNDAPALTGAQAMLPVGTEDVPYTVRASDLLQGFSDADGDTLVVSGLGADHGAVADNGDGTFTVTPAADYSGPVVLTYGVADGHGGSVAASQGFSLVAANGMPRALDIVSVAIFDDTVWVRPGDGAGDFGDGVGVSVGSHPIWVALGDLNGDGKLDFVTTNQHGDSVSVRLGDGAGGFGGGTELQTGNGPWWVALGDFDGTGGLTPSGLPDLGPLAPVPADLLLA